MSFLAMEKRLLKLNNPEVLDDKRINGHHEWNFRNGDKYIGNFTEGKKNDENGVYRWADGFEYRGAFVNNIMTGHGTLTDGSSTYTGDFVDGKMDGNGRTVWSNGNWYEGEYRRDTLPGHGVWEDPSHGVRFEGRFFNGVPSGHGTITTPSCIITGEFVSGYFTRALYRGHDGSVFEGEYVAGSRNGHGTLTFPDKRVYVGEFVQNKMEGRGAIKYPDNTVYEGFFRANMKHGEGFVTTKRTRALCCGTRYTVHREKWEMGHPNGRWLSDEPPTDSARAMFSVAPDPRARRVEVDPADES